MSMLFFAATRIERGSGGFPTCQWPVPQESMRKLWVRSRWVTRLVKMPSARGERQMFPRQMKRTEVWLVGGGVSGMDGLGGARLT